MAKAKEKKEAMVRLREEAKAKQKVHAGRAGDLTTRRTAPKIKAKEARVIQAV